MILCAPIVALTMALRLLILAIKLAPLIFIAWIIWSVSNHEAKSEPSTSRSFYDARGSFAGSSTTYNGDKSTSFYDARGRFSGSAIKHGNSTSFYDGRGRFTGTVINTGPRR